MQTIVRDLRDRTHYFADRDLLDNLEWFEAGPNNDRLITRESAQNFRNALDACVSNTQAGPSSLPPRFPPPATLSAVVRLSTQQYSLTSCGNWDPESQDTPSLAFTMSRALVEDPFVPQLAGEFQAGMNNLERVCASLFGMQGDPQPAVGAVAGLNLDSQLRIYHKVFQTQDRIPAGEEEDSGTAETVEFKLEDWPLRHAEAKPELEKLKDTHFVVPLPAYDQAGELIRPTRYEEQLKGAIVRLFFGVRHWTDKNNHAFTADIQSIRVLVPPSSPNAGQFTRKRVARFDDYVVEPSSARKKARQNI